MTADQKKDNDGGFGCLIFFLFFLLVAVISVNRDRTNDRISQLEQRVQSLEQRQP